MRKGHGKKSRFRDSSRRQWTNSSKQLHEARDLARVVSAADVVVPFAQPIEGSSHAARTGVQRNGEENKVMAVRDHDHLKDCFGSE